jgi:hypothetical protein
MKPARMRWVAGLVLLGAAPALAVEQDPTLHRYEARTIVTGTDLRSRPAGFAACLTDVLVKVSGDPTLAAEPRLAPLAAHAADYVVDFDYWDRMSGISHHDEQGSGDRPYNLTVRFDPGRIAAALRDLGRAPWPDPRPTIVALVHVEDARGGFDLTSSAPRAGGMRAALVDTAQKYGVTIAVPDAGGFAAPVLPPGEVALRGQLVLSEAALGWVAKWHLDWQGRAYDWGIGGVNFDAAFRDGAAGAIEVLSGHGAPQ